MAPASGSTWWDPFLEAYIRGTQTEATNAVGAVDGPTLSPQAANALIAQRLNEFFTSPPHSRKAFALIRMSHGAETRSVHVHMFPHAKVVWEDEKNEIDLHLFRNTGVYPRNSMAEKQRFIEQYMSGIRAAAGNGLAVRARTPWARWDPPHLGAPRITSRYA